MPSPPAIIRYASAVLRDDFRCSAWRCEARPPGPSSSSCASPANPWWLVFTKQFEHSSDKHGKRSSSRQQLSRCCHECPRRVQNRDVWPKRRSLRAGTPVAVGMTYGVAFLPTFSRATRSRSSPAPLRLRFPHISVLSPSVKSYLPSHDLNCLQTQKVRSLCHIPSIPIERPRSVPYPPAHYHSPTSHAGPHVRTQEPSLTDTQALPNAAFITRPPHHPHHSHQYACRLYCLSTGEPDSTENTRLAS